MVAVINTGRSIRAIFNYNENKVSVGAAQCIGEGNYPMDVQDMNASVKLNMFLKLLELNENVTRNSVHISLNFDPSEKELSKEKLMEIAGTYMDKIGFGDQPYLVYQHHDAGHPHIHIVSIKVKADGSRIDMQNIGKNQSETARKEIETQFNLVRAESKKKTTAIDLKPVNVLKINYGNSDSKKAIAGILNAVIPHYKFTTLGELNAVLNLYNVSVLQGKEDSKMFLHKGLLYQIINADKKPIGVPIKASSFHFRPTLKALEQKFEANKKNRIPDMKRVRNSIDMAFLKNSNINLDELEKKLLKEGIAVIYRQSSQRLIYGITYVDHTTKCVFNGSVLGVQYAAKAMLERCGNVRVKPDGNNYENKIQKEQGTKNPAFISELELQNIIDSVLQPEYASEYIPASLKGRRKKRKRKGQSDD
ncbi:relaxase/mobilization nuclease domain-containing protein [Flavobacterium pectinovorum]|uniref:Relaxase n=1 Tax=Flavobacterium pectinovorum TaxID=29533 RepID=A0A502F5I3_9FLAO|nr:relaxase/mobilization nuclease domain-containing protein [Flavobacterium pectinovorum]TPG44160.1 relaxase [Flavobacterium pectinovorum]